MTQDTSEPTNEELREWRIKRALVLLPIASMGFGMAAAALLAHEVSNLWLFAISVCLLLYGIISMALDGWNAASTKKKTPPTPFKGPAGPERPMPRPLALYASTNRGRVRFRPRWRHSLPLPLDNGRWWR